MKNANLTNEAKTSPPLKKPKTKNLSPAKKFKLRLRRAKFQKQQQAKDDYFEHDNREAAKSLPNKKKKAGRLNKKDRRAKMYIDAYLKSRQNGDTVSQDDSSTGNDLAVKSMVQKAATVLFSSSMTSSHAFKQTTPKVENRRLPPTASKCCCHCACSNTKRKPRRKLSSPYFGDFNRLSLTNGSHCTKEIAAVTTKILNKTTATRETLVKADTVNFINYNKIPLSAKIDQQILKRNFFIKDRGGMNGVGACEMRKVARFEHREKWENWMMKGKGRE